jgi:hypothetical protein
MNGQIATLICQDLSQEDASHCCQALGIPMDGNEKPQTILGNAVASGQARISFIVCVKPPHPTQDEIGESLLIRKCYTYKEDRTLKGPEAPPTMFGMPFPT